MINSPGEAYVKHPLTEKLKSSTFRFWCSISGQKDYCTKLQNIGDDYCGSTQQLF